MDKGFARHLNRKLNDIKNKNSEMRYDFQPYSPEDGQFTEKKLYMSTKQSPRQSVGNKPCFSSAKRKHKQRKVGSTSFVVNEQHVFQLKSIVLLNKCFQISTFVSSS